MKKDVLRSSAFTFNGDCAARLGAGLLCAALSLTMGACGDGAAGSSGAPGSSDSSGFSGAAVASLVASAANAAGEGASVAYETGPGNRLNPQTASDAAGNAMAVWQQYDGNFYDIWARRYTKGTGWGPATLLEANRAGNAGNAIDPQISFDAAGNALAAWRQSDGTRYRLWAIRYTANTGWGTAVMIASNDGGDVVNPQVAFDTDGNALAVWTQADGGRDDVWSNRYTVGVGWGVAGLIETDNTGDAANPQIAFDEAGNALAVWCQSDGTTDNVWANRYTAGAGWGTATTIDNGHPGNSANPKIAFDARGNALAVWTSSDSISVNLWANQYILGLGWVTAALMDTDTKGNVANAHIVFDANGNSSAAWSQFDGIRFNVKSIRLR